MAGIPVGIGHEVDQGREVGAGELGDDRGSQRRHEVLDETAEHRERADRHRVAPAPEREDPRPVAVVAAR